MKARLQHITFTGIDEKTDIQALCDIQKEYPVAEFGVLISQRWEENGNRYMNPSNLANLAGTGLRLSCHACGKVAREALNNNWTPLMDITKGYLSVFNRCQLNVSTYPPAKNTKSLQVPQLISEVIIQQKDPERLEVFNTIEDKTHISVLLDASGGHGVDTSIAVYNNPSVKVGYAGGISPLNVEEKLSYLLEHEGVSNFWIDMESGVRTVDWFDLNKVLKVLQICKRVLESHS